MNAKVQEFIDKMMEKQKEEELKQREEFLISLGLIDEEKTKRGIVYLDIWDGTKDCKFDNEKNKYYKESFVPAAIEVTDEEYQEILKYAPLITREKEQKAEATKSSLEKTIEIIGIILVIISVIEIFMMIGDLSNCSSDSIAYQQLTANIGVRSVQCLYLPLILGFAKVVGAAEKYLKS
ncbi:MAG: hypothetical protein E7087_01135 [Bacteroidales bacterium]|nr:hypothetical protein [Bacteroidales bacterium]